MSRTLRRWWVVFVRRWLLRLRHPGWYYSWPTPFVLWRDARGGGADAGRSDAIYLWPNGLRWWFLGFALFFVFSVIFFLGPSLPNSWYLFGISLAVFVWMVWFYPFLVFYVWRREVLADLWGTWPPQLDRFYSQQASELVTRLDKRYLRGILLLTLLPVKKYRSAANDGSIQATLERVALVDYLASKPSPAGIWYDRSFLRWLITRCGPVIAGQLVALGLLVLAFLCQAKGAILPILVWTGLAAGFLWHAAYVFGRECRVSLPLEDLSRLPYLGHTFENTYLLQTLPPMMVRLAVVTASVNFTVAISLFELIG